MRSGQKGGNRYMLVIWEIVHNHVTLKGININIIYERNCL